jgi:hypothetical protein
MWNNPSQKGNYFKLNQYRRLRYFKHVSRKIELKHLSEGCVALPSMTYRKPQPPRLRLIILAVLDWQNLGGTINVTSRACPGFPAVMTNMRAKAVQPDGIDGLHLLPQRIAPRSIFGLTAF